MWLEPIQTCSGVHVLDPTGWYDLKFCLLLPSPASGVMRHSFKWGFTYSESECKSFSAPIPLEASSSYENCKERVGQCPVCVGLDSKALPGPRNSPAFSFRASLPPVMAGAMLHTIWYLHSKLAREVTTTLSPRGDFRIFCIELAEVATRGSTWI